MALSRGSKTFVVLLVLAFALVGGGLYWVNLQLSGMPGPGDPVEIAVGEGATAATIGETLEDRGVVRNALAFRLMARSRDLDERLLAGTYELETGMSVDEAIDTILGGPREPDRLRVTVQEGLSVPLTLERLAEQTPHAVEDYRAVLERTVTAGSGADGALTLPGWVPDLSSFGPEVAHPVEGLLFPETYFFEGDASPATILQRMVNELGSRMEDVVSEDGSALGEADLSRYEAAIVASLVERETRVNDERATVAGVIHNRLAEGQPLQIDATVLYALGRYKDLVLTEDTEVDSPYNTYQGAGLPPTPIAGFGEASLRAAAAPADVPYRYYVLRAPECDGSHVFAETLEEHNANKSDYIDAGRCGAGSD